MYIHLSLSYRLTLLILLLSAYAINGQQPTMWQLTDDDGLPSNTIYTLLQDTRGYIWMGTSYGVCRYDGSEFENYSIPHFKDQEILQLKEDYWSRIWVLNLTGQFSCIQNLELLPDSVLSDKRVQDICFDRQTLWLTFKDSKKSAYRQRFGLAKIEFDTDGNYESHVIYEERYHRLLFAHQVNKDDELFLWVLNNFSDTGSFKISLRDKIIKPSKPSPFRISDKTQFDNNLFFFNHTQTHQIMSMDQDGKSDVLHQVTQHGELNHFRIFDNYHLYCTQNGLYYKTNLNTTSEVTEHWLRQITCNTVMLDNEGNHWVSTDGQGIFVIPSLDLRLYNSDTKDLPNNNVYDILYDEKRDLLFVGVDNGKVVVLKNNTVIDQINLPNNGRVLDLVLVDKAIWCFTDSGIFQVWSDGSINRIIYSAGKRGYLDSNMDLLAGTSSGIETYKSQVITKRTYGRLKEDSRELPGKRIYGIHRDEKGTLWIGTAQGLFTKKTDVFEPFTEKGKQQLYSISNITASDDGDIWVSTLGEGVFCIKNDSIVQRFSVNDGLSSNTCKNIFIDGQQLWVGTNNGINIIDLSNKNIRYFNKYDGLPTNDISAIEIIDTTAWVGTSKGLVAFSKNLRKDNTIQPPVYITGLKIWDRDTAVYDSIYLQHDQNNLEIEYTGFGFSTQGNIRYKYKMEGIDPDWNLSNTNRVRYSSLSPGEYTFKVIAINEDNIESKVPAQMQLVVEVPWWDSYWFKLLLAIAVVTGLSMIYLRTSRQKARQLAFQNTVNELRMQALQTQVNPHFIFNALNAIQQFQVVNDREKAIDYLSQFAHLTRMIFEHSKEKAITLSQEMDFLKLYLELEKLRFKDKVSVNFHVSPELLASQQIIKVPPLLIQPIIENAFKHGLFHKGHDGKLNIDFQKKEEYLVCTVEDNGVGRAAAEVKNLERNKDYQSSGLNTSEKRLKIYNRSKSNGSTLTQNLKVTDLYNKQQEATGTKVEIRIRIKN